MIAVLDSGVGGLPYLDAIGTRNLSSDLLYVADSAGFPYGSKSPEVVQARVVGLALEVQRRWPVQLFVIACNTASVIALEALRATVGVPCVGVVPAVKPAAAATKHRRISLLSTDHTAGSSYTTGLIDRFAAELAVQRLGAPDLVEYAEHALCATRSRSDLPIRAAVARIREHRSDVVVLACTHFVVIKAELQTALGPEVTVLDSVDGVARRVVSLIGENSAAPATDGSGRSPTVLVHTGALPPHLGCIAASYRTVKLEPAHVAS